MNKYKEGQIVHSLANPEQKLVVRRYIDRIYFCRVVEEPEHRELAFFERELSVEIIYSLLPKEDEKDKRNEYLYWN